MIEGLFNQTGYMAAKKMLDLTALRHEAIASNPANLETPHYRRMEVSPDFSTELRQAIDSGDPQGRQHGRTGVRAHEDEPRRGQDRAEHGPAGALHRQTVIAR